MDDGYVNTSGHSHGEVPCFADFLSNGPYAGHFLQSQDLGTAGARLFRFSQPAGSFPDPASPDFVVQLKTHGSGGAQVDLGAGKFETKLRPTGFLVNIPGEPASYELDGPAQGLVLVVPCAMARRLAGLDDQQALTFDRVHEAYNFDPLVEAVLRRLAMVADQSPSTLLVESAITTLIASLQHQARTHAAPVAAEHAPRLDRVIDYIDANLGQDLSLADLAGVACLSSYHFARVFKRVTGSSPLSFVQERRIERARRLLALRGSTLAQVSYECGFANQAHFTTVFKRHMGVTPGQYRAEVAK